MKRCLSNKKLLDHCLMGPRKCCLVGLVLQKGQIHYHKWSKVPPTYSHFSPLHTKVVYNFFGSNYLYFIVIKGQLSEIVGKRSRGLYLKGPKSLFGVSGVQFMSNSFFIKLSSMAHHLIVFFGLKSIFEDHFHFFLAF